MTIRRVNGSWKASWLQKNVVFIPTHQATRLFRQSTCYAVVLYIILSKVIIKASQWDVNHDVPPPIEHCFNDLRQGISVAKPLCASLIRTDSRKHSGRMNLPNQKDFSWRIRETFYKQTHKGQTFNKTALALNYLRTTLFFSLFALSSRQINFIGLPGEKAGGVMEEAFTCSANQSSVNNLSYNLALYANFVFVCRLIVCLSIVL